MNEGENPLVVYLLGLCPALAVSDLVSKAFGLGAAVTAVLVVAGTAIPLLARLVPQAAHSIVTLATLAALVSLTEQAMQALAPGLRLQLGIYLPIVAVNCLILGRLEGLADSRSVARSVLEALARGALFTAALVLMAGIREALGSGTITLLPAGRFGAVIRIPGLSRFPVRVMSMSAGALLLAGYLCALAVRFKGRARNPGPGSSR